MFGLANDELAVLFGGAYLALRILAALARILWWYVTDARRISRLHPLAPLVTGAAVAAMLIGLQSIIGGGLPPVARIFAYVVAGILGFVLGIMLDFLIDLRLYRLSDWLMGQRVPQYREQLLYGEPHARIHAARQLATLGARAIPARPELIAAFKDESAEVRATVARAALHSIPDPPDDDPELAKAARPLLTDPELSVRVSAAAIVTAFGAPPADVLPVLCDGVKSTDAEVSSEAARTLWHIGPAAEGAIPALRESVLCADEPNLDAVSALGKIGALAVPVLVEVLERGDSPAKWNAARALGDMGEPALGALPALRKLANHPDLNVKSAAQMAIKKLGGDIK